MLNNLNSIILEGNLTRDPVLNKTPKGVPVCRFTVASNRYFKADRGRREEVGYFDIEVWSRLAETCGEYLSRGRGVRVVGRLKQDRWTGSNGENRSKVHIVGEHVEFRTKSKGSEDSNVAGSKAGTAGERAAAADAIAPPPY